jgi:hypothetical protein
MKSGIGGDVISFRDLLAAHGYSPKSDRVKVVRHTGEVFNAWHDAGYFELYQQYQWNPIFDACDEIISCFGEENSRNPFTGRFLGVYAVEPQATSIRPPMLTGAPNPDWITDVKHFYGLTKKAGFEDLEDRVVIDCKARNFAQWFRDDREVLEIRPLGRSLPPFRDYLRVCLTHTELVSLVNQPDAHKDWVAGLKAVGAIYLIVDILTGQQYVGSATGSNGLWQRWCEYAKSGHGENQRLRALCAQRDYPAAFRFSILETFSRTLSREESLTLESFFKKKLGTRAFGLNVN